MSGSFIENSSEGGSTESIVRQPSEDTRIVVDHVNLQEDPAYLGSQSSIEYTHQNSSTIHDDSFIVDNCTLTESDVVPHESVSTNRGRDARPLMKRSNEVLQQNTSSDRDARVLDQYYEDERQINNQAQSVDNTESFELTLRMNNNTQIRSDVTNKSQRLQNTSDQKQRDHLVVERQPSKDDISAYELKLSELMSERTALVSRLHQFVCSNADLHEEMEMMRVDLESERQRSRFHEERQMQLGQELARARSVIKGLEKKEIMNRGSRVTACVCMDESLAAELSRSIETASRQQEQLKNLCEIIDGQRRLINSIVQDKMGGPASEVTRKSQAYATALEGMNINKDRLTDNNSRGLHQESSIQSPTSPSHTNIFIRPVYPPSISPRSSIYMQSNDVMMVPKNDVIPNNDVIPIPNSDVIMMQNNDVIMMQNNDVIMMHNNDVIMRTNDVIRPNNDSHEINLNIGSYKMSTPVEETDPPCASRSHAYCISQPTFSKGIPAEDFPDSSSLPGNVRRQDVESVVQRTSLYDRMSGECVGLHSSTTGTGVDTSDEIDIHQSRSGQTDIESGVLGKVDFPKK